MTLQSIKIDTWKCLLGVPVDPWIIKMEPQGGRPGGRGEALKYFLWPCVGPSVYRMQISVNVLQFSQEFSYVVHMHAPPQASEQRAPHRAPRRAYREYPLGGRLKSMEIDNVHKIHAPKIQGRAFFGGKKRLWQAHRPRDGGLNSPGTLC